ncbi:MAG: hypothetical protein ACTS6G_06230 [Candidatus Hodgkinia cicadicola]
MIELSLLFHRRSAEAKLMRLRHLGSKVTLNQPAVWLNINGWRYITVSAVWCRFAC